MTNTKGTYWIILSVSVLFLVVSLFVQHREKQEFLNKQTETHMNQITQTLGLALSNSPSHENRIKILTSIVSEMNDFELIELTMLKTNKKLYFKHVEHKKNIPDWFVKLPIFHAYTKKSL